MAEAAEDIDYSSTPERQTKAQRFFERAQGVADANQHDYAIELYLQGLKLAPDDLEAHTSLRKIALTRKATGGKPIGTLKAMGLKRQGKDPSENFINARQLLAFDPGNTAYMELFAKAAAKMRLKNVVTWIGPMLFRALIDKDKPDADGFIRLKDVYKSVKEYRMAADALGQAAAIRPDESGLQHELRELAAQSTMQEGKYDQTGSNFHDKLRNAEGQRELLEKDSDIRTADAMQGQIAKARREFEAEPEVDGKLTALIEALTKAGDLKLENEALDLLEKRAEETKAAKWRLRAGEIKIRQFNRGERMLRQMVEADPSDDSAKQELKNFRKERAEMELAHFQEAAVAYPTEMKYKFEQARRLFDLGRFDEAIPLLQQTQNDAKYRDESRLLLGRAFLAADFPDEAADTLGGVIENYRGEADDRGKAIYYWHARANEAKNDIEEALKSYSQIAQWDFGYRDVQKRIKALRAKKRDA